MSADDAITVDVTPFELFEHAFGNTLATKAWMNYELGDPEDWTAMGEPFTGEGMADVDLIHECADVAALGEMLRW